MSKVKRIVLLILCLVVPLGLGFLSSLLSGDIRGIYESLNKPPLSPPGWLFGVVWPVLYVLMGVALYLVLDSRNVGGQKRPSIWLFCAQLVLNFAWSIVFFRFGQLWAAVGIIGLMDILVFTCVILFYRIRKPAGLLMIPYLLWILFATYLSISFAMLN